MKSGGARGSTSPLRGIPTAATSLPFHNAWRYRDYAVAAFNADKPFDQFLREQIIGGLLRRGKARRNAPEQLIAAGFLMVGSRCSPSATREKMDLDVADEQIDTVRRVFLDQTLGCARCHDHGGPSALADPYTRWRASFTRPARRRASG
ncbi:MAG: DUF1549 domain-containing protein [Verrucomicrobiales bacterium]